MYLLVHSLIFKNAQNNSANGGPLAALEVSLNGGLIVALEIEDAKEGDKKDTLDIALDNLLESTFASAIKDATKGSYEDTPKRFL